MRIVRSTVFLSVLVLAACGGGGGGGGGGGPIPSDPTMFFVRASAGDDVNDGTSPAAAFRTIGAALGRVTDGDTVIVGPGTYNEAVIDPRGGIQGSPVVVRADSTGNETGDTAGLVIIDASGILDPNDNPLPAIRLSAVQFLEIDGFSVKRGATAGIQIRGRGRDPIEPTANVTIRNCQVFDNQDEADGILIQDSHDILIFNNAVYRNDRRGIVIVGSPRVSLINNTVFGNGDRGIFVTDRNDVASTDTFLRNNISQSNGAPSADGTRRRNVQVATGPPDSTEGFNSQRNLVFPAGYQPTELPHPTDINSDALFVSPNSGNFRLSQAAGGQPETSPAVDAGVEESAPGSPPVDFESLRSRTTAGNGTPDTGAIDLGYHARADELSTGGVTWYVRLSGRDIDIGNRVGNALRTIGEAADRAAPGDRIVVGSGVYEESVESVPSGDEGLPILFFADVKGELTGDPPGDVVVTTQNAPAPFRLTDVEFVVIDGFVATGGSEAGFSVRTGSRNVTIRNCQARDNETGILIVSADDILVVNNLATDNNIGIDARGAGRLENIRLINNTVVDNSDLGIGIGERATAVENALVQNNVVQDNGNRNLEVNDASVETLVLRHNLVFPDSYSPSSLEHETDLNEDALLAGNFRLQNDSPAIDAGDPETDSAIEASLATRSATENGAADSGEIDLGYHFVR